jgi:hypothetical protein
MERDPRQDRDGLHVDVDGEQIIGATLGPGSAIFEKFVMRIFFGEFCHA